MESGKLSVAVDPAVFFAAAICSLVLTLKLLCDENDKRAGIITFKFDFANSPLANHALARVRSLPGKGIIPPLPSRIRGVGEVATTVLPGSISGMDKLLPTNCSLGTTQYCVGFENRVDCNRLPLHLSYILPKSPTSVDDSQIRELDSLQPILDKVNPAYIEGFLTLGLCLIIATALLFAYSIWSKRRTRQSQSITPQSHGITPQSDGIMPESSSLLSLKLSLIIGLLSCVLFAVPTVILCTFYIRTGDLHTSVKVEKGQVPTYCLGAMISVIVASTSLARQCSTKKRS